MRSASHASKGMPRTACLLLLPLLLAGCPTPGPAPRPSRSPVTPAPIESDQPVKTTTRATPAPAPTTTAAAPAVKPSKPLESPALRLRLIRPEPGKVVHFGPVVVRLDVYHEEPLDSVRVNGQEAEWRFSRDLKPNKAGIALSRTRYQLRLKYPVWGKNPLTLEAEDRAGRVTRREEAFVYQPPDAIPPTIKLLTPADGATLNAAPVLVKAKVTDVGKVARVTINEVEVTPGPGGVYQASMTRPRGGVNRIRIDAWDGLGNRSSLRATFRYRPSDTAPPTIQVIEPDPDRPTRDSPVTVVVRVVDSDGEVSGVRINGKPAKKGKDGFYRVEIKFPLVGRNPIRILAWDPAGNRATLKTEFRFE